MKHNYAALFAALALFAAVGESRPALAADTGSAAASPASSQPIPKPLKGRAKRLEMLETQLNLTDDQIAQVKTILQTEEDKARSVKTSTDLSPDEKRTQTEALRKETRQQINTILTPDQRQRLRQAQRNRLAGGPAASAASAPGTQPVPATPANP